MGSVLVKTKTIVEKFSKDVKFLQPVFEAITNSLEANATQIKIEFFKDNPIETTEGKIEGFEIVDNGEGFTRKNVDAFCELWTDNKIELGCKGSGRFTWLSVYNVVEIESKTTSEQQRVSIIFDCNFDKDKIIYTSEQVLENSTRIKFFGVTNKFFKTSGPQIVDKRCVANLESIKKQIEEYLLIKLFLLKSSGKRFNIELKLDDSIAVINNDTIPDLDKKEFEIHSDITDEDYKFEMYYQFVSDKKNSKKVFYCSNYRATKLLDDDALGFSCGLPNNDSFTMLVCSEYFDGKDNEARSDLSALTLRKSASIDVPLLFSDINPETKSSMQKIILERYPQLSEINKDEEKKAIEEAPYLSEYIKSDTDILKNKKSLLTKAQRKFEETKVKTQDKFVELLKSKKINSDEFKKALTEISSVAIAELGEYIVYRESIIKGLALALNDSEKKEKYIHDILMPIKSTSVSNDTPRHLLSNLWLIDDKFMTYSYAASDVTVGKIKEEIGVNNQEKYKVGNRPDILLFYDKNEQNKNLIMIELKVANASKHEKEKALTELPNNVSIVKKHIDGISSVWSYIITAIDDDFKFSIENLGIYEQLFSNDNENRAYYRYNKILNTHDFIIDIKCLVNDALARNKTFIDILKSRS